MSGAAGVRYIYVPLYSEMMRKILSVPEEYRIVGILALGTPEKGIQPHSRSDADPSKIHNII